MQKDRSLQALTGNGNGNGNGKVPDKRNFPVNTLSEILIEIKRQGGTGCLEIHFRNGSARGEAKWNGFFNKKPE